MQKEELLELLKNASEAYYNNQELLLTDEEYDSLTQLAEENGWLIQDTEINDGIEIDVNNEVHHDKPMKSLKKANSIQEVNKYYEETKAHGAKTYSIEPKLDGLALSVHYISDNEVILSTRGNGEVGENVTYLIESDKLTIENLPLQRPDTNIKELRGELYSSKSDLIINNQNKVNDKYSNERSAVAGIVSKGKLGLDFNAKLSFATYFAVDQSDEFTEIPTNVFSAKDLFPKNIATTFEELTENIEQAKIWRM